jgi:hypothetical protein
MHREVEYDEDGHELESDEELITLAAQVRPRVDSEQLAEL